MKLFLLHKRFDTSLRRLSLKTLLLLCFSLLVSAPASAAKVLIIGETQYALVADVVAEIQLSLRTQARDYAIADVRGKLNTIVEREDAQVVVALGMDAVGEALRLPSSIAVVYGLVVVPPKQTGANITGVYMAPPVSEYASIVRRYIPDLGKVSVLGSPQMMKSLYGGESSQVSAYHVASSSELINTVNRLGDTKALLLLPDASLLTTSVMENIYLFSFRNNIPLLGVSEASVKQGSLFALVFDPKAVSRQIGEKVQAILNGDEANELPPSPPKKFNLYVNSNTARKMGIDIPEEMLRKAKKIY